MKKYLIGFNIVLCVFSAVAVYISISLIDRANTTNVMLRNTRVESQRLQQSIGILESSEYQELIGSLDSDLNELKISVAEFMSDDHAQAGASDVSYQFDSREEKLLPQDLYPIRLFRLNLKFKARNAMALAGFLQATKNAVSPWPMEVRACDIHRLIVVKLLVHCVLDVHYWGLYNEMNSNESL
jgi:hypothetical protein